MKPEEKIKAKCKRRLQRLAKESGLPFFWDTPPASEYGSGGRPDHHVGIGSLVFHIEVKASNTGKPTPKQKAFHDNLRAQGVQTLMVCGEKGIDNLYFQVRDMIIDHYSKDYMQNYISDVQNVLLVASRLGMEQPRNKQQSLDIKPGTGTPMGRP